MSRVITARQPQALAPRGVTGLRHDTPDANGGLGCFCGCQHVVGLPGTIVEDSDTAKLAQLDPPMCIAEFEVPCTAGGPTCTHQVAYTLEEIGL